MKVLVSVTSLYQMQGVQAQVGSTVVALVPSGQGVWSNAFPMSDLPSGNLSLTVTATDVFSNTAQVERTFRHDLPPVLTVLEPLDGTVARPTVRLHVTCVDDDPQGCASLTVKVGGTTVVLASGQTEIDQVVSLAAYEGRLIELRATARDSSNHYREMARGVFVESSTRLVEVENPPGIIFAVKPDRLLYREGESGSYALTILDRTTRVETTTPLTSTLTPFAAQFSPTGAIFIAQVGSDIDNNRIYEWRDGVVTEVGGPADQYERNRFMVAGPYALWYETQLNLRDLNSGTTTPMEEATYHGASVAANGDVVFTRQDEPNTLSTNLWRYREGSYERLTTDGYEDLTDGVNVVYTQYDRNWRNPHHRIRLYTPTGDVALTELRSHTFERFSGFTINQGWVAYTEYTGDRYQVWSRAPTGEQRQVSFFGTDSTIDALSPDGEVMFFNANPVGGNHRYLAIPPYDTPPTLIGSMLGSSAWIEGQLYVAIGRSLFVVAPEGANRP